MAALGLSRLNQLPLISTGFILCVLITASVQGQELRLSHEARLLRDLLARYARYGTSSRPTYNSSTPTLVSFGLRLIQLDVDEKNQLLKSSAWLRMRWLDEYLFWKPEEYGGIDRITVPRDKVWLPDITLVNTAEAEIDQRHSDINVHHEGWVFYSPHKVYNSACLVDVSNFPYDRHTCRLWFQSMSHFTWNVDLEPYKYSPLDLQTYLASFKESQEWEILANTTERFNHSQEVGVLLKFSKRVALRFTLTLQRRKGYLAHLLMLPCVFLICMNLIVFCLPPERPDRHTLAMSIFASFMVLLLILVEVAPPSAASVPKLGVYYACNMSLTMVSIFLSAIVINISRRGDNMKPVPRAVKVVIIDYLSRAVCLHERVGRAFKHTITDRGRLKDDTEDAPIWRDPRYAGSPMAAAAGNSLISPNVGENRNANNSLDHRLRKMEDLISKVTNPGTDERDYDIRMLRIQWRNIAIVLDRCFFIIYAIVIITTTSVIFPKPS